MNTIFLHTPYMSLEAALRRKSAWPLFFGEGRTIAALLWFTRWQPSLRLPLFVSDTNTRRKTWTPFYFSRVPSTPPVLCTSLPGYVCILLPSRYSFGRPNYRIQLDNPGVREEKTCPTGETRHGIPRASGRGVRVMFLFWVRGV